jgi:hypothetical protein
MLTDICTARRILLAFHDCVDCAKGLPGHALMMSKNACFIIRLSAKALCGWELMC